MVPGSDTAGAGSSWGFADRPDIRSVDFSIARAMEKQGDLEKAAQLYQRILQEKPNAVPVLHRLAITQDKLGNHEQAGELFRQAIAEETENPVLLADYGYHLHLEEQYDQAESLLRKAIRLDPHSARAKANLALVLCARGHFPQGRKLFAEAGLSPRDVRMNIAFAHTAAGDLKWGRAAYARLEAERPGAGDLEKRIAQIDEVIAVTAPDPPQSAIAGTTESPLIVGMATVEEGGIEVAHAPRDVDGAGGTAKVRTVSVAAPIASARADSTPFAEATVDATSPVDPSASGDAAVSDAAAISTPVSFDVPAGAPTSG